MTLPHFSITKRINNTELIYRTLYEITLIKDIKNVSFISFDEKSIPNEIFTYNLQQNQISFQLKFDEQISLIDFCNYFKDIKKVEICVFKSLGIMTHIYKFEMYENMVNSFIFKQLPPTHENSLNFNITLNFKKIISVKTLD